LTIENKGLFDTKNQNFGVFLQPQRLPITVCHPNRALSESSQTVSGRQYGATDG